MSFNATLLGQTLAMIVFVLFCMKFIWPPVIQAMRDRQKKIADGIYAAERAENDLVLAQDKVAEQLREAKQDAAQIIEQAKHRASQIVDEAKDQARLEGERIKLAAQSEVEQSIQRAKESLRKEVGSIALVGAEKILQQSVDAQVHDDMLEKLAAEL